jgi:hypothetical protein
LKKEKSISEDRDVGRVSRHMLWIPVEAIKQTEAADSPSAAKIFLTQSHSGKWEPQVTATEMPLIL